MKNTFKKTDKPGHYLCNIQQDGYLTIYHTVVRFDGAGNVWQEGRLINNVEFIDIRGPLEDSYLDKQALMKHGKTVIELCDKVDATIDEAENIVCQIDEENHILKLEIRDLKAQLETILELKEAAESWIKTIPAMCKGDFSQPCALHVRAPIEELYKKKKH